MVGRKSLAITMAALILASPVIGYTAEKDQEALTFRKKVARVVEKNEQTRLNEEVEQNRKTGIMPYFVAADNLAKTKDYSAAAAKLDEAAKMYPADYPPLLRWRAIYHTLAGDWNDVIFLLKDQKNDVLLGWCLATSYRQIGLLDKAEQTIEYADRLVPAEFKIPKYPPEIKSFENIEQNYPWLAAMLVYSEKAVIAYTRLNDSKDANKVISNIGEFAKSVPPEADLRVLPFNNVYGLDLSDVALVAGFAFLADGTNTDAKELFDWYVKNKRVISPLDKRFVDEARVYMAETMAKE